jgi:phosphatidylethanolamine/phosphatidyl-N-methylethanolamine N-methyltransferase
LTITHRREVPVPFFTMLADYRLFFREFRKRFETTGAIAPSGAALGRALARYVGRNGEADRVLEVGPGTGAVTAWIARRLRPGDRLDLVELNDQFVERLRERLATEPLFKRIADQTQIFHQRIEELPGESCYGTIVSGLPLNNFPAADVKHILNALVRRLRPGGTLSFFEYVAVRPLRSLACNREERERLRGVGSAIGEARRQYAVRRDLVWPNVPPAWVHHLRRNTE